MKYRRSRAREQVLQLLYLMEFGDLEWSQALDVFHANFDNQGFDDDFARGLAEGVCTKMDELNSIIQDRLEHWRLARVSRVDRNILRLGAYELVFCPTTPLSVVIDEAVELAKKYGDSKTSAFVNGILDRIARDYRG